MAASATPRPKRASAGDNPALAPLQALAPALPVAVAYSGGADSTALLLAAARTWPGQIRAIHIHHGLQAAADEFTRHCEATCRSLQVPLDVVKVNARNEAGDSPEDAARRARYAALAEAAKAHGVGCVLLAQHADDQVETMLLALSRGAGLPGLAAMPERFERHGTLFLRPLLDTRGDEIRAWLQSERIAHVEDPMNADTALTRSRIRHDVIPALAKAFPQFRETFSRSARHAAQAQSLLMEVASQDLAMTGDPPMLAPLRSLSRPRRANVLRHWLRASHEASPSAAQLEELLDQVEACTTRGHRLRLKVADGFVVRAGERLDFVRG